MTEPTQDLENPALGDEGRDDAGDDTGDSDDDSLSETEYRQAVSQLIRVSPPPTFKHGVEDTIRRRSGGRFFGRKAFGDRIPYEVIAIVILILGVAVYAVLRSSTTGSLRYENDRKEPPRMAPGAKDVVPQPRKLEAEDFAPKPDTK